MKFLKNNIKPLLIITLIAYSLVLIWIYYFKCNIINDLKFLRWESSFNFNPIADLIDKNGQFSFTNLGIYLLNILGFIGFGVILGELVNKKWRILVVSLASFLFSFMIEMFQLIFSFGSPQLIDLVTNTLGGVIGVVMIHFIKWNFYEKHKEKFYLVILIISLICIILGIIFTSIRWNDYIN